MAYTYQEGNINVFKNDRKQEGDNLPQYTGKCMIDGKMKDISLWVKDGTKGKFFSGKIKPEYIKPSEQSQEQKEDAAIIKDDTEDLMPF